MTVSAREPPSFGKLMKRDAGDGPRRCWGRAAPSRWKGRRL